jgi:hypothetical protein
MMAVVGVKKMKMIKVEQSYIDSLLTFCAACPPRPLFTDFTSTDVVSCERLCSSCEKAAVLS